MKKILLGFAAATFFASATSSAFAAEKVAMMLDRIVQGRNR